MVDQSFIGSDNGEEIQKEVHFYCYLRSEGVSKVELRFKQPADSVIFEMTKVEECIYYTVVKLPEDCKECKYTYVKIGTHQL